MEKFVIAVAALFQGFNKTLAIGIGAIGLWVGVGIFWGKWVNPLSLAEKPSVAIWSLIVLGLWNTTITQLLWLGGLAAASDMTRAWEHRRRLVDLSSLPDLTAEERDELELLRIQVREVDYKFGEERGRLGEG